MADSDQSLEILIKTILDATGYRMNEQEQAKLKAGLADAKISVEKLTDSEKEGTKAADKSEISHRALHQILHLIGHEAGPAAGAALSGIAAAATGGILFAVMAVRELFNAIGQARDEAKKFKEEIEQKIDLSGVKSDLGDVKKPSAMPARKLRNFSPRSKRKNPSTVLKKSLMSKSNTCNVWLRRRKNLRPMKPSATRRGWNF